MLVPSKDEFLRLTSGSKPLHMPVSRDILADMETPLSAYWKLAHDETYSFLLESVTGGEQLARYSILGVRPRLVLRTKDRKVRRITPDGEAESALPEGQDPLHLLEAELPNTVEVPGLPKFHGGAVGMIGYDAVRFFERLPNAPTDDLNVDDLAMMLAETVIVFDHAKNLIRIIVNVPGTEQGYAQAQNEIERIVSRLKQPIPPLPAGSFPAHPVTSNFERQGFESAVGRVKEYIAAGDGIQMVLSQRFETEVEAHPLTIYRALRSLNPSPYMFLLRFGEFDIVGASPEILVSLQDGTARVRPIAGTRWRGNSPEEDDGLADELLKDEKERAEHVMLVDLGRNDLGRVCEYGSVKVNDLMTIERYSHVMHIVSDVTGELEEGKSAFDLVRASFPAGTVSGAPKVRAMQVIDELEPTARGAYAGAVGYFGYGGDMDMAITIRSILLKGGKAYVQAGAGLVYDSVPSKEFDETCNKAKACLKAIEMAQSGLEGL
ncbi:MAG: anthranilate synthase component I [Fimbriimonadales bacterium]